MLLFMPTLCSLVVNDLRNLHSVSISLSPAINIFYGKNGSGKTSVLEAASLLGLGRSFRSHKIRSLIQHEKSQLTIFSEICPDNDSVVIPTGIQKNRKGETAIKVSGRPIKSAAELAHQLPLIIINADSFRLIEGPPIQRRHFLDWMVFHVKPEFASLWRSAQKLVKQRNSLLRHDKISPLDLAPWDKELGRVADQINILRSEVFQSYIGVLERMINGLFDNEYMDIAFEYYQGWDEECLMEDALRRHFDRDCRNGYTHVGPQRADIKIQCRNKPAVDVLSRGQEKTLIAVMLLAQSALYTQQMNKNCVFLVDDLLAELDKDYSQRLAELLIQTQSQILVTGVEKKDLLKIWDKTETDIAVFHVKQGNILSETDMNSSK